MESGKADGIETAANENQKLYYHVIGEAQEKDVMVAEFPENPNWRISTSVSDCGSYLMLFIMKGCKDMLLYFTDLRKVAGVKGKFEFVKVVEKFESDYDVSFEILEYLSCKNSSTVFNLQYITNDGSVFTFLTNNNASNYRVINIDFSKPQKEHWTTLIEVSWAHRPLMLENPKINLLL